MKSTHKGGYIFVISTENMGMSNDFVVPQGGGRRGAEPRSSAQLLLFRKVGTAEGRSPEAASSFCCSIRWGRRGVEPQSSAQLLLGKWASDGRRGQVMAGEGK